MTHHPNHTSDRYGLVPIDKPQTQDPYPDHSTREKGVRPHTRHTPAPAWKVTDRYDHHGPLPVAASVPPSGLRPPGRRRLRWCPFASVALSVFGQIVLTAAIAFGAITPLPAIVVCLLWVVCSLLLIAAQVVSESPRRMLDAVRVDATVPDLWNDLDAPAWPALDADEFGSDSTLR